MSIFLSLWSYPILEDLDFLFWFPTELCLIHNKSTNKLPTHSFFDAQTLTNAPGGKSVTVIVDLLLCYKIKCICESCFFILKLKYYEYFAEIMKSCIVKNNTISKKVILRWIWNMTLIYRLSTFTIFWKNSS